MENFDKYYRSYKYMEKLLQTDFTHNYLNQNLEDNDKGQDILAGKTNEKVIDMEWVTAIEDTLGYMEKAIDEQRRFIKETQEVYRIDKAKIINKDSVKHLSQHTNFIAKVEGDRVTPNKVLTVEREESFEIYENRFLITLIRLANQFVNDKYRKMVDAPTDTYNRIEMKRDLVLNNQKVTFNVEYSNEIKDAKADDLNIEDYESLSDFDRVRRIREKLNSFLNTPMMKEISKCIPVRPPILHTNLMMKNPNYKGCLDLYNYLNAYKKPGYEIVGKEYTGKMDEEVQKSVYFSLGFQHFMMSISTNPALKNLLEQRYQEENEKWDKEKALPVEEQRRRELERIEEVRKEEMKIRLAEIREREKIIRDQKSEIAALKREIEKRDKTIESLKSTIKALEEEVSSLQNELQKIKVELIKAKERIAELEARVAELEAKVTELEAKIAELEEIKAQLEAKVAELEKIKAELEAKIAELEQIVEEQKAKIAELEGIVAQQKIRIAELEAVVTELERIKAELESKVDSLEKENAQQKATIAAHEETIAKQKANIATLEEGIAAAKAEIASLTDTLSQRDNTIAQQSATIENLNTNITNLQNDLDIERKAHSDDVEAEKQAHINHVAELNKMFEAEKATIENNHKSEISKQNAAFDKKIEGIKAEHKAELDKLDKRKESEKKQIQKTCDQRVKAAQKEAEKKANAKAKEEIAKAQKEARLSAKKANEKAAKAKADFKAERGIQGLYRFDYTIGALGMQTIKALDLTSKSVDNATILQELTRTRRLSCIYIVRDNKKITVSCGGHYELSVVKTYKGEKDFEVCKKQIADYLANADKSGVYLTYKTMDKLYVNNLAKYMTDDLGFETAEVFHNKAQKPGCSTLGIYYYRG